MKRGCFQDPRSLDNGVCTSRMANSVSLAEFSSVPCSNTFAKCVRTSRKCEIDLRAGDCLRKAHLEFPLAKTNRFERVRRPYGSPMDSCLVLHGSRRRCTGHGGRNRCRVTPFGRAGTEGGEWGSEIVWQEAHPTLKTNPQIRPRVRKDKTNAGKRPLHSLQTIRTPKNPPRVRKINNNGQAMLSNPNTHVPD